MELLSSPQKQLSFREGNFVIGVLQGKTLEAAARDAGYSDSYARKEAWKLMRRPHIQRRIQEALAASGPTPEQIVQEFWHIARGAPQPRDRVSALSMLAKIHRMVDHKDASQTPTFHVSISRVERDTIEADYRELTG